MTVLEKLKFAVRRQLQKRNCDIVHFPWPGSLAEHLARVFEYYAINVVFDVGANGGQYARVVRMSGYDGLIVSFEPGAEAFARLAKASKDDPRWIALNFALGREASVAPLRVCKMDMLSSFWKPVAHSDLVLASGPGLAALFEEVRTEPVPIRRLDEVFGELRANLPDNPRAYLKLDTQGFDVEVFAGSEGCRSFIHALQSEVSFHTQYEGQPSAEEALHEFRAAGFTVSAFFPVAVDPHLGAVEMDCVMVRSPR